MATRRDYLEGYDRIKGIGKGAFGTAILYKRLSDNKEVVIKEIFLCDMTDNEKQLAFNEASVLKSLNHPNIIRYMSSFEREGSLMIEMEYANNGNLAQLINLRRERNLMFKERDILDIFSQITAAIGFMHSNKILHRDLKSANIFLNKNGTIKIGDFGISKILNTRAQAQTVVGTPYYLSPEMCEGKEYDQKSDIWSIGCILYELACFRKPFEAPSLPSLVQKITMCEFEDIPDVYSKQLSQLVQDILQRDNIRRPTAQYIHYTAIPNILHLLFPYDNQRRHSLTASATLNVSSDRNRERSVLYQLSGFDSNMDLIPIELPTTKIICFSASDTHFIVVTIEKLVYAWGKDNFGQLAQGVTDMWRKFPICAEYLRGKNIIRCAAGDGFSVFLNESGLVYTCGDGRYGCIGHNNWNTVLRPTIIDSLLSINIIDIKCGSKHVLALSEDYKVYSWGSSSDGQLGLRHEKFCCTPTLIKLSAEYQIVQISATHNTSALMDAKGRILVCGSNQYNKLGVQNDMKLIDLKLLRVAKDRIIHISLGVNHTIVVTQSGRVISLGKNTEGQLGVGNCNTYKYPQSVPRLPNGDNILVSACGSTFTVVGTTSNVIYFWGTYYKENENTNEHPNGKSNMNEFALSLKNITPLQRIPEINEEADVHEAVLEKQPKSILALHSSKERLKAGHKIWLEDIHALQNGLMILVHTTAPAPLRKAQSEESYYNSNHFGNSVVPDWMNTNLEYSAITTLPNTTQHV